MPSEGFRITQLARQVEELKLGLEKALRRIDALEGGQANTFSIEEKNGKHYLINHSTRERWQLASRKPDGGQATL